MVYFVESGRIKVVMPSINGKDCLLGIYGRGDLFGETCLSGIGARQDLAIAMEDSVLRRARYDIFMMYLREALLVEEFLKFFATRLSQEQQKLAEFVTLDSEHRLGNTLLRLGERFGKRDEDSRLRIPHRISHEELSQIVGTTRPRVSEFLQKFKKMGLLDTRAGHFRINDKELADYLCEF